MLFIGNLANLPYVLAKELRSQGENVTLLMNRRAAPIHQPESMGDACPEWVVPYKSSSNVGKFIETWRYARKFDSVTGFYNTIIPLQFMRKKYVAYILGSDYRVVAHNNTMEGWLLMRAYRKASLIVCSQMDLIPLLKEQGFNNVAYLPHPVETCLCSSTVEHTKSTRDDAGSTPAKGFNEAKS